MLVITRKLNESILVADNIEVTVLEITKDKVRLGVNAPREVKIIRSELKAANTSNVEASKAVSQDAIKALIKHTTGNSPEK